MRNRIPFLQRVMDEVHRQAPPPATSQPVEHLDTLDDDAGPFAESGATPGRPLQMFVEVDALQTLVADALEALRWSEGQICTTPGRTAAWERAVDQRRQFLNWLQSIGRRKVFLAMYPEYMLETDGGDEDGGVKTPSGA
jgi:hypothetical protein